MNVYLFLGLATLAHTGIAKWKTQTFKRMISSFEILLSSLRNLENEISEGL